MKDIKISKAGIEAAKQSGLILNEYVYLSYLSSFTNGCNQRIEKIAEVFNVSAILLRRYNSKLRKLGLLDNDKYVKLSTEKGKQLSAISLRSDKGYFYIKFPFQQLGTMNNNLIYCMVSQMIKNSKQSIVLNGITYKAYTSENDVMLFFVNQIVSVLGLSAKTARSILQELIANNYLILKGNYLIDTEFAVIPIAFTIQNTNQNTTPAPARNAEFSINSILDIINERFNEVERKQLVELLLNDKNKPFQAVEKQSNTNERFYNYPLLKLPILSRDNEQGLKNPLHCFLIDSALSENDKQVFYSFWQNLVKDFGNIDKRNTEYHFNGLLKKCMKSVDNLIDYIVAKYKEENGMDGVGEFEF